MSSDGQFKQDLRSVALNLTANLIWSLLVIFSGIALIFVIRATEGDGLAAKIEVPAWLILVIALGAIGTAFFIYVTSKRASVVRGRKQATRANVTLLASRRGLDTSSRVIRSTRFGRWPPNEDLSNRTNFRQELELAIVDEGADVKSIWNVSSTDDVNRLRALLERYEGRTNHSIRAYFGVADHLMPELLIVDKRGASISFTSTRTPTAWTGPSASREKISSTRSATTSTSCGTARRRFSTRARSPETDARRSRGSRRPHDGW